MKAVKTFTCAELGTVYKDRVIEDCSEGLKKSLIEHNLVYDYSEPEPEPEPEPKKSGKK